MLADDPREAVAHRVFLAQQQIFAQQFLLLRRALQQQFQVIQVHRLLDEIERAFLHRGHGFFHRTVRRHQDHRQRGFDAPRFAQHIQAGTAGKFQIGENQTDSVARGLFRSRNCRPGFFHRVARALQRLAEHGPQFGFIFDKEDRFHEAKILARPAGIAAGWRSSSSASEMACWSASTCFFLASILAVFSLMSLRV